MCNLAVHRDVHVFRWQKETAGVGSRAVLVVAVASIRICARDCERCQCCCSR